jgi:uncharacterized membrane protein YbaN (DUF454 family)
MIASTLILLLVLFFRVSHELNNGLGRTPQMGKTSDNIRENSHIHSILLKAGIVGIILDVMSMRN